MKILLLNGPPDSGKDFIAKNLVPLFNLNVYNVNICKFAGPLKTATHRLYNVFIDGVEAPHDYFEDSKETPNNEYFHGITPRQAYINVAEKLLKPVHGVEIFGKLLTNQLQPIYQHNIKETIFIITDSGFEAENNPLINMFGLNNLYLFRIFRDDATYEGDSRSYVNRSDIKSFNIDNNGDIWKTCNKIFDIIHRV